MGALADAVRKSFAEGDHPRWPKGTPGIGGRWRPDGLSPAGAQVASDILGNLDPKNPEHRKLAADFQKEANKVDWKKLSGAEANVKVHRLLRDTVAKPLGGEQLDKPGDTRANPIDCGDDVDKAAELLIKGKHVQLNQPRQVSTLIDKLGRWSERAQKSGGKLPPLDLCKVSVKHTNLFCAESKGIERVDMPQLSGVPLSGSKADKLPKNKKGEADIGPLFREYLTGLGHKVIDSKEKASFLRATQDQLNGEKVAGIMRHVYGGSQGDRQEVASVKKPVGKTPKLFVSGDNYIIDGHHRWAAVVGLDTLDNQLGDPELEIQRIDLPVTDILSLAKLFAADYGMPQASVTKAACTDDSCFTDFDSFIKVYRENQHPRDPKTGEWIRMFAYGSNLDPLGMNFRAPNARRVTPATLPDHRLTFPRGVANVEPAKGAEVPGGVYDLSPEDVRVIDAYEGFPHSYGKRTVTVQTPNGPMKAMTYFMRPGKNSPRKPTARYLGSITAGLASWDQPTKGAETAAHKTPDYPDYYAGTPHDEMTMDEYLWRNRSQTREAQTPPEQRGKSPATVRDESLDAKPPASPTQRFVVQPGMQSDTWHLIDTKTGVSIQTFEEKKFADRVAAEMEARMKPPKRGRSRSARRGPRKVPRGKLLNPEKP